MKKNPLELSERISMKDMLYLGCGQCDTPIIWIPWKDEGAKVASCCGYVYHAYPLFDAKRFHVTARKADPQNVVPFRHKKR